MAQSGSGRPFRQADQPTSAEGAANKPAMPSGRRLASEQPQQAAGRPAQALNKPAQVSDRPAQAKRDTATPAVQAGRTPSPPAARTRPRQTAGETPALRPAPAATGALSASNRYILIGAGVLAAVLIVVALMLSGNKPSDSAGKAQVGGSPAGGQAGAVPAAAEKAQAPSEDVEPADPDLKKQWLLNQYEKYASANPEAFGEQLQRLTDAEKRFEKDEVWIKAIQRRVNALKQRAEKKAEELVEAAGKAATKKAESGDYKGALAELDKFPGELSRTEASTRVFFFRKKLSDKALEQYQAADQRAEQASQAGDYEGALKAFEPIASFGHPQIDKLVAARRAEIKDIQKRGKNPSEGKTVELAPQRQFFRADVYVALPGMVEAFEEAYLEGLSGAEEGAHAPEGAQGKTTLAEYPRSAVLYYVKAMLAARRGATEEARWCGAQASRLALPNNNAFRSRLLCLDSHLALFAGGDLDAAGNKSREALDLDSKNPEALFLLGIVHYYLAHHVQYGNKQQAASMSEEYLRKAVELEPRFIKMVPPEMASAIGVPGSEKYKTAGVSNPYLASVVQVDGRGPLGGGEGTGWSVQTTANKVFIITNNHVIKGFSDFTVTYQFEAFGSLTRKISTDVKVIGRDAVNDLALLQVGTEHEIKPLPLRATTSGLALPMKVTMIGHPHGLDFTVMSGELDNLNRVYEGSRHLQINSNADCGMSGGPVIDEKGYVIGVTVAKLGSLGQSIAILSEHVRDLCAKYGVNLELMTPAPAAAK